MLLKLPKCYLGMLFVIIFALKSISQVWGDQILQVQPKFSVKNMNENDLIYALSYVDGL